MSNVDLLQACSCPCPCDLLADAPPLQCIPLQSSPISPDQTQASFSPAHLPPVTKAYILAHNEAGPFLLYYYISTVYVLAL